MGGYWSWPATSSALLLVLNVSGLGSASQLACSGSKRLPSDESERPGLGQRVELLRAHPRGRNRLSLSGRGHGGRPFRAISLRNCPTCDRHILEHAGPELRKTPARVCTGGRASDYIAQTLFWRYGSLRAREPPIFILTG